MTEPLSSSESAAMPEGYAASKILTWVLGIVGGLVTVGIIGIVTMLGGMGDRLTAIETVINENRQDRERQVGNLERRIERIEGDLYERRRNGGRDD